MTQGAVWRYPALGVLRCQRIVFSLVSNRKNVLPVADIPHAPMVYLLPSLSREGQGGWVSLSFQFSPLVAARVAAALVLATLGDVLFARCSGSSQRILYL